jgi:phospholipase/carboxylesterase
MTAKIDGPRVKPINGAARQLVVILHGFGADGNDLIEIGRQWQSMLPDAAFVAPHAHEPCAMAGAGRQWFRLTDRNPHERWSGACSAHPVIDAFIDNELASLGLTDKDLVIVGFSQGAMMALHTGLRRKVAPAGIIAFSGALIGPEHLAEATARNSAGEPPPILMVHGHMDEVVPVDSMFAASSQLAGAGIPSQWHLAVGLGHGIDGEGIRHGVQFLNCCFGRPTPEIRRR